MRNLFLLFMITKAITISAQQPTNKHFWCVKQTNASPESIWKVWTDVENWKDWDTGLKNAHLESDSFQLGAKGKIISLEGRTSKFKIVEYHEGHSYTLKTKLPLGSLYVKRYLSEDGDKQLFTHEVWFKGLTAGIFSKAFGKKFRAMLPDVMDNINEIAEP